MTAAQSEILQAAFNRVVWAHNDTDVHAVPRAESRLFDVCLDQGMSFDEPNHIEWAAERINEFMGSL